MDFRNGDEPSMAEVEAALAEGTPSGEAAGSEAVVGKLGADALAGAMAAARSLCHADRRRAA